MAPGVFITLEGGEGAGKSTQARLLAEALRLDGHEVELTREPGGTPGAEALRDVLLFGAAPLSRRAQVLGHMAARADHLDGLICPALARGAIVVCDRFHDSTVAYQGYGLGMGDPALLAFITAIREEVGGEPDLTLLLTVPPELGAARIAERGGRPDRYEVEARAFHERVADGFATLAQGQPERFQVIDASPSQDQVAATILAVVRKRLASR
ncbi:dTMP kinase [Acidomonas methanolica]|uniref:dTMP kinase n=1 Tax=Acidomonas methanolica TaxID=437 RepID=UPI00211A0D44|nr:dTMP kinase [Acidomonas methanolica]MCQ9154586.1 dTMP kinase [Acidomonas methanolica]